MASRYLLGVWLGGRWRVAQRGRDGEPELAGIRILDFLRGVFLSEFRLACAECSFYDPREKADMEALRALVRDPAWQEKYPWLGLDFGWRVLSFVHMEGRRLIDCSRDGFESWKVRWAYVIDLDTGRLEVYQGRNKEPVPDTGRWPSSQQRPIERGPEGFEPVRRVASWSLNALPSNAAFLDVLDPLGPQREEKT